jgi:hypothetical protein
MSFDGSSAVAIQKAQSIMKKPGIKNQLIYVRSNFKIICESITQLEKNGLPLTDSIKIVENVFTSLKKSPGPVAAVALKKLEDVTEKNPGYKLYSFREFNKDNICKCRKCDEEDGDLLMSKKKY